MGDRRIDLRRIQNAADPREIPAYGIPEAAHYLGLPIATLRSWTLGRCYPVEGGRRSKKFKPLFALPNKNAPSLSFFNLAEAHVLSAFRRQHRIPLQHIRSAIEYVAARCGYERPLIDQRFQTDGVGLLIDYLGNLIDASARGQVVMRKVVEAHLQRLEWENELAARFYPFTRARDLENPKSVLIDPCFSFGRPVLAESHIATAVIAERYKAGDSVDDLARDYGCARLEIEEGLRCELALQAAA